MPFNPKRFAKRAIKKRYMSKNRRGKRRILSVSKIARDIQYLKANLNSETKFITTSINAKVSVDQPLLLPLDTPIQGLKSTMRTGYKVKYTHQSGKLQFTKANYGDTYASCSYKMYIIWLKDALDASTFNVADILNPDFNSNYSMTSYFNRASYGNWIATHKHKNTITDHTTVSQWAGDPSNPLTANVLSTLPQLSSKYHSFNKSIQCHSEWATPESNSYDPSTEPPQVRCKPYLLVVSDAPTTQVPSGNQPIKGNNGDTLTIKGMLRLSYVDN